MAVPKKRSTKRRKGYRKIKNKILITLTGCKRCKELKKPHTVCRNCGFYDEREIIKPKIKNKKPKTKN